MSRDFSIVTCNFKQHAPQILSVFNDAILNSTALYEYQERTLHDLESWFETKSLHRFPVVGIESEGGVLMGFASYGSFRSFPANLYTVEHSIYVHSDYRGRGFGRILLELIIEEAKKNNMHTMIGCIDANNHSSKVLHEKLGFKPVGVLSEVGFKFDRWLDLALYQLMLDY